MEVFKKHQSQNIDLQKITNVIAKIIQRIYSVDFTEIVLILSTFFG